MDVRAPHLHELPLFRDIPQKHLDSLLKLFAKEKHAAGHVLFKAGDVATRVRLLVDGEVTLSEQDQPKFRLHPLALIGELGALTGTPRNTTATVTKNAEILSVEAKKLQTYFESHADVALPIYRTLLSLVSEKIRRDKERMDQMRSNIIRTQKAMKELRDVVLSSGETPISKKVVDTLEVHIERNRRAGYRVSPLPSFPAQVRLESGTLLPVLEISNGYMKLQSKASQLTKDKSVWVGVLVLPKNEVAVSGSVEREAHDGVVVKLDLLPDDYRATIEDYVTGLQLLDFVV